MPTLYDVAHFVAWNGYAKDMLPYLGVDKAAWNNDEFWFPYAVNQVFKDNKTRIHKICDNMTIYKATYNPAERIKQLLAYGANIDMKSTNGNTPLHICCRNDWKGHMDIIKILINAGADINARTEYGFTPLYLAAANGHLEIVKLLMSKGAIHMSCEDNDYPIDMAAQQGHLEVAKLLISHGATVTDNTFYKAIDKDQNTVLKYLGTIRKAPADSISYAVWNNKTKTISTLARIGGDLNYEQDGRNLVERAIFGTDEALLELCKAGADLNRTAVPNAMPPIFLILMIGNLPAIKMLCKYGANVNVLYNVRGKVLSPILYMLSKAGDNTYETFMELLPLSDLTLGDVAPLEYAERRRLTKYVLAIGRERMKRKFV
jgi:ankyrin repeat protein